MRQRECQKTKNPGNPADERETCFRALRQNINPHLLRMWYSGHRCLEGVRDAWMAKRLCFVGVDAWRADGGKGAEFPGFV